MKISNTDYAKTLHEMTKGKSQSEIDGVVLEFAKFLIKKKQANNVSKISEKFSKIWNDENRSVDCVVLSAQKLEGAVVEKIKNYVKLKYEAETVNIENQIEKKIKGGIVIKVGDEMIDMSIEGMLSQLKKQLSK
ncbi:MAG: hypothetical protein ACD_8C00124G0043 [uncultured bacterium]|nr:MAG: hypothetical protein ACD_8C00124G0043 [uncultured bacterium]